MQIISSQKSILFVIMYNYYIYNKNKELYKIIFFNWIEKDYKFFIILYTKLYNCILLNKSL